VVAEALCSALVPRQGFRGKFHSEDYRNDGARGKQEQSRIFFRNLKNLVAEYQGVQLPQFFKYC
jgi:hypothetical protein